MALLWFVRCEASVPPRICVQRPDDRFQQSSSSSQFHQTHRATTMPTLTELRKSHPGKGLEAGTLLSLDQDLS